MGSEKIKKGLRHPIKGVRYGKLCLWGYYYRLKYFILNKRVKIGPGLKVRPRLSIKGPGGIRIGKNVTIDGTSHSVTLWTYAKEAQILIGDNVFLNGTRFGCRKKIEIGDDCIIADCRILDTDFHSINPERRNDPEAIRTSPISIGNNVWIAMDSVVLPGVSIGENSTIAARSVVTNNVEPNSVCGGNPAKLIKRLS